MAQSNNPNLEVIQSLLIKLNATGLNKKDQVLYDFLKQLATAIQGVGSVAVAASAAISGGASSGGGITQLVGDVLATGPGVVPATVPSLVAGVLSDSDITAFFPNSRELLAGTNISFDDTVPNERTVNISGSADDYVVMSSGAEPGVPLTDGSGNFIYIPYVP